MTLTYIKLLKGMHDYVPDIVFLYQYIEEKFRMLLHSYSYNEIRTPIIENTVLFTKHLDNTKIHNVFHKQMYTFKDRNNIYVSLRPEGTIGCMRAYLNHLYLNSSYNKFWYIGPMFRYENPQLNRYRQFIQMGVEVYGYSNINIDLELILIISRLWKILGISQYLDLEINDIGTFKERQNFIFSLTEFIKLQTNFLSKYEINYYLQNPLKCLDNKNKKFIWLLKKAPKINDFLNLDSLIRFKKLCTLLKLFNIKFKINRYLMRGLDYYNNFVFEWISNKFHTKTVCAGGRYDHLVNYLQKDNIVLPAVGFAIGLERVVSLYQKQTVFNINKNNIDIYIISSYNNKTKLLGMYITEKLLDDLLFIKIYNSYYMYNNINKYIIQAISWNVHILVLIGKYEYYNNYITVKNLWLNKMFKVNKLNVIKIIKNILNKT